MKRSLFFLMTLTALLLTASGCQIAATGDSSTEQLVGYYITASSVADRADEDGRIYAQVSGSGQDTIYTFLGLDGVPFYEVPVGTGEDAAMVSDHSSTIRDRHLNDSIGEKEEMISLEGTLYVSTETGQYAFYQNPMYQDGDGNVYLIPTEGPSDGQMDQEGTTLSIYSSAATTKTQNGNAVAQTFQIQLHVVAKSPADQVVWCQMGADNREISRLKYTPDQVPETLTPEEETAYLIVETYRQGQLTDRTLVQREEEDLTTFQPQPGGWFDAKYTAIQWK